MKECLDFDLEDLEFGQFILVQTRTDGFYKLRRELLSAEDYHETTCLNHSVKIQLTRLNCEWSFQQITWDRWIKVGERLIFSSNKGMAETSPIKRIFA